LMKMTEHASHLLMVVFKCDSQVARTLAIFKKFKYAYFLSTGISLWCVIPFTP
jgi:hypothetical protein